MADDSKDGAFIIPSNDILRGILDEDEKLMNDRSGTFWKAHKQRKSKDGELTFKDECYVHKAPGDAIWSLLVCGDVHGSKVDGSPIRLSDGIDLLDRSLAERQREWHELLLPGGGILQSWSTGIDKFVPDGDVQLCYFAYRAPVFFVSTRDCLYLKIRRSYEDGSILISYRTVDLLPTVAKDYTHEKAPFNKKNVRISFSSAHKVEALPAGSALNGFHYRCYQHADPKGWIPKALGNGPQADVMLKEIEGVRKAVKTGKNLRLANIANASTGALIAESSISNASISTASTTAPVEVPKSE